MKNKSIQSMMLCLFSSILLSMMLLLGYTVYSNYQTLRNFNVIVESLLDYNDFQDQLDTVQDAVTAYFNYSGKVTSDEIRNLCQDFSDYSQTLTSDFQHAQFVDNAYIVQSYLDAVYAFLDSGYEAEISGDFTEYNETMIWYRKVLKSYETTLPFVSEIITEKLNQNSENWYEKEQTFVILGILICAAVFLIGLRIIQQLTRPILALTDWANQIITQEYEGAEASAADLLKDCRNSCRETAVLTDAFQHMTATILRQMSELKDQIKISEKLHELEMENMRTKIALNQSEMSLMQSLISPHFLFNCLSTLTSLAFIENAPQTEQCSIHLAAYLRTFLNRVGKTVTISDEVDHTRQYIEIQQMRFGDRIRFEISCSSECEKRKLPAIILQPLVENALAHGLRTCLRDGLIQIRIFTKPSLSEQSDTIIEVQDNGIGITEEKQRQIQENLKKPFESGEKGVGLRSIAWRLNHFTNGTATLRIENCTPGTLVQIRIPFPARQEDSFGGKEQGNEEIYAC